MLGNRVCRPSLDLDTCRQGFVKDNLRYRGVVDRPGIRNVVFAAGSKEDCRCKKVC